MTDVQEKLACGCYQSTGCHCSLHAAYITQIKRSLGSAEAALQKVLDTWHAIEDAEEQGAELASPALMGRLMALRDKAISVTELAESVRRHF